MRNTLRLLLFITITISLISCHKEENSVFVPEPQLQPISSYYRKDFKEQFFFEKHFGYAYTGRGDSTPQLYTAEVIIIHDGNKEYLRNCTVSVNRDTFLVEINDFSSMRSMTMVKHNKNFVIDYDLAMPVTDTSWVQPKYRTIKKQIYLDKDSYEKGDEIKGKLALSVYEYSGSSAWPYGDTLYIYGLLKTVVK